MQQGLQILPGGLIYNNHQLLYPVITESRWSFFCDFTISEINSGGNLLSWFSSSTLYGFFISYEGDAPTLAAGRLALFMGTKGKRVERYIVQAADEYLSTNARYQFALELDLTRNQDAERLKMYLNGKQLPLVFNGTAPKEVFNINLTPSNQQILAAQITGVVHGIQLYNNLPGLAYWQQLWELGNSRYVPQKYLDGSNGNVYALTTPNAASTGYSSSPTVSIGGSGTGASITANVTNGIITSYTVNTGGSGYSNSDPVVITDPSGGGQGATAWLRTLDGVVTNVYPGKPGTGTGYKPFTLVGAPEANSIGDWTSDDANYVISSQSGGFDSQYALRIRRNAAGTDKASAPCWCPLRPYNFSQAVRVRGNIRRSSGGPSSVEFYLKSSVVWSAQKAAVLEEIGQNWMSFDIVLSSVSGFVKDTNVGTSYAALGIRLSTPIAQNEYLELDNLAISYEGIVVNLTAEGIQTGGFWMDETWNRLHAWQTTGATRLIGAPRNTFSWVWTARASGFMGQDAPIMMPENYYRVSIMAKADANTEIQLGRSSGAADIVANTALVAGVETELTFAAGGRSGGLREVWLTYNSTVTPVTVWINGEIRA